METQKDKPYDLEKRTFLFAQQCRDFLKRVPKTQANTEYSRQLIRSSGSQAANYIEANEALSKKDFVHRIRICRKETKESCLRLRLCEVGENKPLQEKRAMLQKEAAELRNIFTAILSKSQ